MNDNEVIAKNDTSDNNATTNNGDASTRQNQRNTNKNMTPPDMVNCVDDESGETNCEVPEPPDMGQMCDADSDEACETPEICDPETDENCTAPEGMEAGMMGGPGTGGQGGMGGQMGGFKGQMGTMQGAGNSTWHPAAYLGMGAGSVILGLVISYACFSKFFRARPGETFKSLGRFLGFIGAASGIALGLGVLCYFIPTWIK